MICPKCKSDKLHEKNDIVICSHCGFRAARLEYRVWTKIHESKHLQKEKIKFHENKEMYAETYTKIVDKYVPWMLIAFVLATLVIIILAV